MRVRGGLTHIGSTRFSDGPEVALYCCEMRRHMIVIVAATALLAACGGTTTTDSKKPNAGGGDKPSVKVVASGFGQSDQYVQAIVIVTTDSKASVGESATASVNFLDGSGAILGTEDQVEGFKWVGQQLVLPVWLDLSDNAKAKVASIEVSTKISDYGSAEQPASPLDPIEAKSIKKTEYGASTAVFGFTNSSNKDLSSPRIGIVCYDKVGKIVGGSSEFPDLVAAGKTIRIDSDVTVSGTPASCEAFPSYDVS